VTVWRHLDAPSGAFRVPVVRKLLVWNTGSMSERFQEAWAGWTQGAGAPLSKPSVLISSSSAGQWSP